MDRNERKKLGTAASRIRKKLAAGTEVTADESALLAKWDKLKAATGRKPDEPETKPTISDTARSEAATLESEGKKPRETAPPPPAIVTPIASVASALSKPPPEAPPRVLGMDLGSRDWRQKWRKGATDRESTCVQVAGAWNSLLVTCIDKIEEWEGKPIIKREVLKEMIYPSMVLSIDALLPSGFEVRPEMVAAFGTSVTIGQRVMLGRTPRAKEIEAAKAKAAGKPDLRSVERSAKVIAIEQAREAQEKQAAAERQASAEDTREVKPPSAPPVASTVKDDEEPLV